MELAALHSSRPASDLPLEQIAGNASLTEAQKIAEGARQFEALLLRQILQESQKTVFQSKFTDNSTAAGIYRDLVTQQLADSISKSGSLGLAKSLEGQLTQQLHQSSPAGPNPDEACGTDSMERGNRTSACQTPSSAFRVPSSVAPAHRP